MNIYRCIIRWLSRTTVWPQNLLGQWIWYLWKQFVFGLQHKCTWHFEQATREMPVQKRHLAPLMVCCPFWPVSYFIKAYVMNGLMFCCWSGSLGCCGFLWKQTVTARPSSFLALPSRHFFAFSTQTFSNTCFEIVQPHQLNSTACCRTTASVKQPWIDNGQVHQVKKYPVIPLLGSYMCPVQSNQRMKQVYTSHMSIVHTNCTWTCNLVLSTCYSRKSLCNQLPKLLDRVADSNTLTDFTYFMADSSMMTSFTDLVTSWKMNSGLQLSWR